MAMIIRSTWVRLSAVTAESEAIIDTAIRLPMGIIIAINMVATITGIRSPVIKSTVIMSTVISMIIMLFIHVFTERDSRGINDAIAQVITELRIQYVMIIDCTDIDGITIIGKVA